MQAFITIHAMERLQERFPQYCNKYDFIKTWRKGDSLESLKPFFNETIKTSKTNNSFVNNSRYMVHLYETYGYELEYKFMELQSERILFVLSKKRSEKSYRIVTVMIDKFGNLSNHKKYTKSKKENDTGDAKQYLQGICTKIKQSSSQNSAPRNNVKNIDNNEINVNSAHKDKQLIMTLLNLAMEHKTIPNKISNTVTHHECYIENLMYEFTYTKTSHSISDVVVTNLNELEKHGGADNNNTMKELEGILMELIQSSRTIITKISNTKNKHACRINNSIYEFVHHKTEQKITIIS